MKPGARSGRKTGGSRSYEAPGVSCPCRTLLRFDRVQRSAGYPRYPDDYPGYCFAICDEHSPRTVRVCHHDPDRNSQHHVYPDGIANAIANSNRDVFALGNGHKNTDKHGLSIAKRNEDGYLNFDPDVQPNTNPNQDDDGVPYTQRDGYVNQNANP